MSYYIPSIRMVLPHFVVEQRIAFFVLCYHANFGGLTFGRGGLECTGGLLSFNVVGGVDRYMCVCVVCDCMVCFWSIFVAGGCIGLVHSWVRY